MSPVIHIGFAKAASTTLQAFFRSAPDVHGIDGLRATLLLTCKNPFLYDERDARAFLEPELAQAARLGRVPVLSHERLAGNPHSGHYDCRDVAERLQRLLPEARIVVSIREQMAMLASIYKQYVRIGGVKRLEDYLLPVWDCRVPLFDWRIYEYRRLIGLYCDLFGRERVHVAIVEELQADPDAFFAGLAAFMGVRPPAAAAVREVHNPGIPDEDIERERVRNFFRADPASIRDPGPLQRSALLKLFDLVGPLVGWGSHRKGGSVEAAVRRLFQGKFSESNRELSRMAGRDLGAFGYEVAGAPR